MVGYGGKIYSFASLKNRTIPRGTPYLKTYKYYLPVRLIVNIVQSLLFVELLTKRSGKKIFGPVYPEKCPQSQELFTKQLTHSKAAKVKIGASI